MANRPGPSTSGAALVAQRPGLQDRVCRVGPRGRGSRLAPEATKGALQRLELHSMPGQEVVPERRALVVRLLENELVRPLDVIVREGNAERTPYRPGLGHDRLEHRRGCLGGADVADRKLRGRSHG